MRMLHLLFLILIVLLTGLDCKEDNPVAADRPLQPGRRDYVWSVDTLHIPAGDMFYPSRIWGSAPNDVWLAGFGSPSYNLLWHFNGSVWKKDSLTRQINPSALWGTASNNIWLGNSGNSFWRYNGNQWYKFCDIIPPDGFQITAIENIWGKNANDIYGVGFANQLNGGTDCKGIILHFDGTKWQYKPIPNIKIAFYNIQNQSYSGKYFVEGDCSGPTGDTNKIYIYP